MQKRAIRPEEKELTVYLLSLVAEDNYEIPNEITPLKDGGMRTLEFQKGNGRFSDLVQVQYVDSDGIVVIITLTALQEGTLHELDIWKTDFSPLIQFPKPEQVRIVS
jgi:hypothetical protein